MIGSKHSKKVLYSKRISVFFFEILVSINTADDLEATNLLRF